MSDRRPEPTGANPERTPEDGGIRVEAMCSPELIAALTPGEGLGRILRPNHMLEVPETLLGEAARLLLDKKIGCLPVVQDGRVVGIITESDIFRAFMEILGLVPTAEQ